MRKNLWVSLILILILAPVGTAAQAATRQEVQIALDIVRFVNIANNIFDEGKAVLADSTIDRSSREEHAERIARNAERYLNMVDSFLNNEENLSSASFGLQVLGIDIQDIIDTVSSYRSVIDEVRGKTREKEKMEDVFSYIDQNVEELPLVRRIKTTKNLESLLEP